MHHNNTVVTLVDSNRKPLREYNSTRTSKGRDCNVYLPFDSEYQFLIKNQNDFRIRVEIEIDGSNVTSTGLILEAGAQDYIERFVDTQSKFKFVRATDEAVADPTNPKNGGIRVITHLERQLPAPKYIAPKLEIHPDPRKWYPIRGMMYGDSLPLGARSYTPPTENILSNSFSDSSALYCSTGERNIGEIATAYSGGAAAASSFERGATVEGSYSDQVFGTTVWQGDAYFTESVFNFKILPQGQPQQPVAVFTKRVVSTPRKNYVELFYDSFPEFSVGEKLVIYNTPKEKGDISYKLSLAEGDIESRVIYTSAQLRDPDFMEDSVRLVVTALRKALKNIK